MINTRRLFTKLQKINNFLQNNNSIHTSNSFNSATQYYPINDSVFGLTDEQKQVNF